MKHKNLTGVPNEPKFMKAFSAFLRNLVFVYLCSSFWIAWKQTNLARGIPHIPGANFKLFPTRPPSPPRPLKDIKEVNLSYFVLCSTVQHRQGSNTEGIVCGGSTFIFHKIITRHAVYTLGCHFVISCKQSSGTLRHRPSGTWPKRRPTNETLTLRLKNNPYPIPLKKNNP